MTTYDVQVLKVGEADVMGPEVYWMDRWLEWETLYFYIVVLRSSDHTVVINSGPPRDLTALNARWGSGAFGKRGELRRRDAELPERALASIGVAPEDVDHVLITPLQAYATANIPLFRNATICLSKRGWTEDYHAEKFPMHVPKALRIPPDVLAYLEGEGRERLRLLEDDDEILPGLTGFWAGAHHRSSMVYVADTVQGKVMVTDCCFTYGNFEIPHPLGIAESVEEFYVATERMRREGDILIPLYDPEVLNRFPGGVVARGAL